MVQCQQSRDEHADMQQSSVGAEMVWCRSRAVPQCGIQWQFSAKPVIECSRSSDGEVLVKCRSSAGAVRSMRRGRDSAELLNMAGVGPVILSGGSPAAVQCLCGPWLLLSALNAGAMSDWCWSNAVSEQ